jgi:tetratricopeptide (TPR) repeat protein
MDEGLAEINYSLTLDKENAYASRNLGIYHLDKGEFDEALKLFVKSKALDESTDMIDKFIATAERQRRIG